MTTPVKVAVFIDRGEAIRAGRNKWNWQNTELDLEALDASLREALSRCPEEDGALQITHSATRPGFKRERDLSWYFARDLRDSFELEREGMPSLVEATPATALQMLEHLASLPNRLRANGAALLSSAQAQATTRGAQAMDQAEAHLTDLDRWLSTDPQLLIEHDEWAIHPGRYQCVEAPQAPTLATIEDEQIAYDLEEARRLLDDELPRVSEARPGSEQSKFDIFAPCRPRPFLEHLAAAEEALAEGVRTRAEMIKQHRRAAAAAAQERLQAWQDAQQEQAREERRIAAVKAQQAFEASNDAANNQALREWAITYEHQEILKLLDDGASAEQITNTLRSILFEPFGDFTAFKKIRKQDLLIANPNLDDKASGLDAVFDDTEVEFTDPSHQATVRAIVRVSFEANIPAQFAFRLHRGHLTRREKTIGVPLEARSLLLTAHFGHLKISRAFAIGTLEPAIS
jgi:hypothetical protein